MKLILIIGLLTAMSVLMVGAEWVRPIIPGNTTNVYQTITNGSSSGGFNNDTDIRVNRLVLNTTATITKYGNDTFGYWQNTSCIIIGDTSDKSLC